MKRIKTFLAGAAGIAAIVAGTSLLTPQQADARYCMPTMFPSGNWQLIGSCARTCGGELYQKVGGSETFCFIPDRGIGL